MRQYAERPKSCSDSASQVVWGPLGLELYCLIKPSFRLRPVLQAPLSKDEYEIAALTTRYSLDDLYSGAGR